MTIWSDYQPNPGDNNSPPPVGAPEGMPPSSVDDTMREMMSVIRQLGDEMQATFSGLGTMSQQNANNVNITGGSVVASLAGPGAGITLLQAPNLHGYIPQACMNPTGYDMWVSHANDSETLMGMPPGSLVPIGAIIMFAGDGNNIDYTRWAICDGTRGTPDLRDRFIKCVGPNSSGWGGSANSVTDAQGNHAHAAWTWPYTLTLNDIPPHEHGLSGHSIVLDEPGGGGVSGGSAPINIIAAQWQGGGQAHSHGINYDGTHQHNVTVDPPYVALLFIMRIA